MHALLQRAHADDVHPSPNGTGNAIMELGQYVIRSYQLGVGIMGVADGELWVEADAVHLHWPRGLPSC
jgi:hypothetical protein